MKIISCNIRGLKNLGKIRSLKEKRVKNNPIIVLLQETKMNDKKLTQNNQRC